MIHKINICYEFINWYLSGWVALEASKKATMLRCYFDFKDMIKEKSNELGMNENMLSLLQICSTKTPSPIKVIVCGGGRKNLTMIDQIKKDVSSAYKIFSKYKYIFCINFKSNNKQLCLSLKCLLIYL